MGDQIPFTMYGQQHQYQRKPRKLCKTETTRQTIKAKKKQKKKKKKKETKKI